MKVTKYFDDSALEYFERGSIRFNTLAYCRNGEKDRFDDYGEGSSTDAYHLNLSHAHYYSAGGIHIENSENIFIGRAQHRLNFNCHIFCCSFGDYNRDHHNEMRDKNPDLTHYAVIDFKPFAGAIKRELARTTYLGCPGEEAHMKARRVEYAPRERFFKITGRVKRLESLDNSAAIRALFTKPRRWLHENEVRLALFQPRAIMEEGSTEPCNIQSEEIRNHIQLGTW